MQFSDFATKRKMSTILETRWNRLTPLFFCASDINLVCSSDCTMIEEAGAYKHEAAPDVTVYIPDSGKCLVFASGSIEGCGRGTSHSQIARIRPSKEQETARLFTVRSESQRNDEANIYLMKHPRGAPRMQIITVVAQGKTQLRRNKRRTPNHPICPRMMSATSMRTLISPIS
jgi:hypothetical protein